MTMIQRIEREASISAPITPPPGSAWSPSPSDDGEDKTSFTSVLPTLILLGITVGLGFTMMGSFSTVQEGAKAELALSDQSLGLVQGLSAAIPLLLLSIPIGIAVDRTHRVRLLIGLAFAWTLGTALTAIAPNTGLLFAARMLTAIGTTGGLTAALSLTADYCAPALRGRGTLIVSLGQRLGIAAAFALPGWLFGRIVAGALPAVGGLEPWRSTHVMLALLSAALLVPLLFLREPERQEVEAGPGAPFRVVAGELWQRRAFLIPLFAGQVSVVMADSASFIWAAPVLSREYGLSPGDFAGWMGLLVFSSGIVGAVLGGVSADLGQKSGRRGFILLGAVIAAGFGIPAALVPDQRKHLLVRGRARTARFVRDIDRACRRRRAHRPSSQRASRPVHRRLHRRRRTDRLRSRAKPGHRGERLHGRRATSGRGARPRRSDDERSVLPRLRFGDAESPGQPI